MIYRQKPRKSRTKVASKRKTNMKNFIRGFFFCALWYLSIIAGFFLLVCPILPLVIISPKRYRRWSDVIFGMWEPFPVAMMEVCLGIRVVLSGDKINPFEGSLFIMNHRTRVDWNFLWLGLFHCCQPNAHNMKYILKAPIMHFPGPGWVMQTCSFIFVHRKWERDKPLLNNIIDYLNSSDSLYQILLFPEGTDLTEKAIAKSHKYAEENNLEKYYKVLHPRTTGFTFIASKMKTGGQLKAVYDVTIAYPKTMPLSETDILLGKFPEEVHFNVKRHSSENIPYNEEELKAWLNNVWKQKEAKLTEFYQKGSFTDVADRGEDEGEDAVFNLSDQNIDFGKMSIKNGVIKYDVGDDPNASVREVSLTSAPLGAASLQSGTVVEADSVVKAKSESRSVVDAKSRSRSVVEAKSQSRSVVDAKSQSRSVVDAKSQSRSVVDAKSQSRSVVDAKSESGSVVDAKSESKTIADAKSESKTIADAKSESKSLRVEQSDTRPAASRSEQPVTTESGPVPAIAMEGEIAAPSNISCEEFKSKKYRPSHILYLVLVFWIALIILTVHQLCYNIYLQIWVLTHSLLFIGLSFVSNGFHHLAASVYFYRVGRNPCLLKKLE